MASPSRTRKRLSLTDRILGSLSPARRDAGPRRAASSAPAAGQSPIPRIRQWLEACRTEHGTHCGAGDDDDGGGGGPVWRPPRLVDTVDHRLLRARPVDRYAALSYVGGVAPPRMALLSTSVDAFERALPDADLSRTFVDAMWLAKKLGLRYLWVDRLCIAGEDERDRADHVRHMASVFANAHLTIVAAHGDADTGLIALDPRRPMRGAEDSHDHLVAASTWDTRAWTLQESLYSRRAVFLFQDSVAWQCHCDRWQGGPARGKARECARDVSRRPGLPTLALTGPGRVRAHRHGLQPAAADARRRHAGGLCRHRARALARLRRRFRLRHAAHVPRHCAAVAAALPPVLVVDGLVVRRRAGGPRPVASGGRLRRGGAGRRVRAGPGRTLVPRPAHGGGLEPHQQGPDRALGQQRPAVPGAEGPQEPGRGAAGLFRYPVPVEERAQEADWEAPAGEEAYPGPLLAFRTTCGFLEVDYAVSIAPRGKASPPVAVGNVWGRDRQWMGEFRGHDRWLGVQSSNYGGEERLEFVVISAATERRGSHVFSAERFEAHADADGAVDVVNVLWVERIAGVAYRRGLGHVLRAAWEAEADVLLD